MQPRHLWVKELRICGAPRPWRVACGMWCVACGVWHGTLPSALCFQSVIVSSSPMALRADQPCAFDGWDGGFVPEVQRLAGLPGFGAGRLRGHTTGHVDVPEAAVAGGRPLRGHRGPAALMSVGTPGAHQTQVAGFSKQAGLASGKGGVIKGARAAPSHADPRLGREPPSLSAPHPAAELSWSGLRESLHGASPPGGTREGLWAQLSVRRRLEGGAWARAQRILGQVMQARNRVAPWAPAGSRRSVPLPGPSGHPVTRAILAPAVPWRKFQDELTNSDFIFVSLIFSVV